MAGAEAPPVWDLYCVRENRIAEGPWYYGPFTSAVDAAADMKDRIESRPDVIPSMYSVKRCRRAPVHIPEQYDWLIDAIQESAGDNPPDGEAWADWEEDLVEPKVDATRAELRLNQLLRQWAGECLQTKIYIVEDDGKAQVEPGN